MLETEEVDVDYFTPSTSTTLSKIFGSSSKEEDIVENNNSLKYNAPLPPQVATKSEESKQTQFLFADTVYAYEWVKNSYEFRGKLGFAIFNITHVGVHKMVLYDSNKTTLSSLTISHDIEIKVNGKISISYYDNVQKFWSVNSSTSKMEEILDLLRRLKVNLEFVPAVEEAENKTQMTETVNKDATIKKCNEDEKESDTDVSFNRKTKDSILKRMANMGQSVLPPPHAVVAQTSDSSDTNKPQNQRKSRHKPKVMNKKGLLENKTLDTDKFSEINTRKVPLKPETLQEAYKDFLNIDDFQQMVPATTTNVIKPIDISAEGSAMGIFISEQKVSNSELRINMNRMTDKLEILLDKVKDLEMVDKSKSVNCSNSSQFQNEIIQKLLNEYEKKINKYEEFIKQKGFDCETFEPTSDSMSDNTHRSLKNTVVAESELQKLCNEKDKEIILLKNKLQVLTNKEEQSQDNERSLLKEIGDLKNNLNVTSTATEIRKLDDTYTQNIDITNKLKQIMNHTFQAISVNFDDEEKYTGAKIKSIVGLVVKKTTIDSIKEFQLI